MSEGIEVTPEPQFAALLALDWGDQKHAWCLLSAGAREREHGEVEHTPEAVDAWVLQLCQRFAGQPIAVGVEQSRGALVFMLSKYEQLHLFPVPPSMTANLRKAFYSSGAKDDPKDGDLILDLLEYHRGKLRRLSPDSEATRRVQHLVEERRKLVDEKTAHSNRLMADLKIYFPQVVKWFPDLDSALVCDLLERWPSLQDLQKARPARLRDFFRQHHCRDQALLETRIGEIRQAMPAIRDQAVIEAKQETVKVSVGLIRVLQEGIRVMDRKIQEAAAAHPDFFIFDSLPGAGPVMAPRLLAAFGSQRQRYADAREVQIYSGIAPVVSRSGNSCWIHFRFACPKFLRQTFHEWAGHSIAYSGWARAFYERQRRQGKKHHAAVRALAYKWIRVVFRCWQSRVAYDEGVYLAALRKAGSPLAALCLQSAGEPICG